jgi:hypothetical protein
MEITRKFLVITTNFYQEKHDLEITINFLPISKKQGNSQEISGNSHKFLRRLGNCLSFFLIFPSAISICLAALCYLWLCMPTLNAVLSAKKKKKHSDSHMNNFKL